MRNTRPQSDKPLAITGVTVIDPVDGNARTGQTVIIKGDQIVEVTNRRTPLGNAESYDGRDLFACPGLIDAHVHVMAATASLGDTAAWAPSYLTAHAAQRLSSMLARGFTTVRDVGGADYGLAAAITEGLFQGPRLIFGGKALSQTGGHADFRSPSAIAYDPHPCCSDMGIVCDGVAEVRKAARLQLRTGAHHVKMMLSGGVASPTDRLDSTQFSQEEISAAVEEAEAANRYVTAHAYTAQAVNRGLELGVRCIEHGVFIDDESIRLLLKRDAFVVPTLSTHKYMVEEGERYGASKDTIDKGRGLYEAGLSMLLEATRAGVNVVFGTDLLGGMLEHQSDEFLIRAKVIDQLSILQSATLTPARLMNMADKIGRIIPGYNADLLLLKANPLDDVGVLAYPEENISLVVARGQLHSK